MLAMLLCRMWFDVILTLMWY